MEHGAWSMGHGVVNIEKIRNLIGSNRKSQIANRKFLRPSDFRPSDNVLSLQILFIILS